MRLKEFGCVVCIAKGNKLGGLKEYEVYKKGNKLYCEKHVPDGAIPLGRVKPE